MDSPTAHRWEPAHAELKRQLEAAGIEVTSKVTNLCWEALFKVYEIGVMDGSKLTPDAIQQAVAQAVSERTPRPNRAARRAKARP